MREGSGPTWVLFLLFLTLIVVGCLPSMGEAVLPQPPTAPPPPTAVPLLAALPPPVPHSVEGARRDCLLCHAVGAVEAPPVPSDSYHMGPNQLCSTCHGLLPEPALPTVAAPPITHDIVGREECFMCHKMGIGLAPRTPENHNGLPVDVCQTCHVSGPGGPAGQETAVPTNLPSQVPHPVEDRADCRLCHETGVGGASQFPADHADRANEVCQVCHAVTMPEETPVGEARAPEVPHTLEGRAECRLCHETGIGGASQFPADHADRANDVCRTCHAASPVAETPVAEAVAPQVPHTLEGRSDCGGFCHETGAGGAPQFPADHTDRANEVCQACHSSVP